MPLSSEHLAAAEELAEQARTHLKSAAYREADTCSALAAVYVQLAHARQEIIGTSTPSLPPAPPLPEWCGKCDGPDLKMRWIVADRPDGGEGMRRCPDCNPYAHSSHVDTVPPSRDSEPDDPAVDLEHQRTGSD